MLCWDDYRRALAGWEELSRAAVASPLASSDSPRLEDSLLCLLPFRGCPLLLRWHGSCEGPISALRAVDVDGDGQVDLIVATASGGLHIFRQVAEGRWEQTASAHIPAPIPGPVSNILVEQRFYGGEPEVSILAGRGESARLFSLLPTADSTWELRERRSPGLSAQTLLATSYGDFRALPQVLVHLYRRDNRGRSGTVQVRNLYCEGRLQEAVFDLYDPIYAVAYDDSGIYIAGGRPHLRRLLYRIAAGQLVEDTAWGEKARLSGSARSLSLFRPAAGGEAMVLAVTDEREITAFAANSGDPLWHFAAPDNVLAVEHLPGMNCIVTGARDGTLRAYEVVGRQGLDAISEAIDAAYRRAVGVAGGEEALLRRWLADERVDLACFAVERALTALPNWRLVLLDELLTTEKTCLRRQTVVMHLLTLLEQKLLADRADSPEIFQFLRRIHENCQRPVHRRIDLLLARYTARYGRAEDPAYQALRQGRRPDMEVAQELLQTWKTEDNLDALRASLALYEECLTSRRQRVYLFASEWPVTALQVLPLREGSPPQAVVAAAGGAVALLELNPIRVVQVHNLRDGETALEATDWVQAAGLHVAGKGTAPELVLATANGWLLVYPTDQPLDLARPARRAFHGGQIWSSDLVSSEVSTPGQSWILVSQGRVLCRRYDGAGDSWNVCSDEADDKSPWMRAAAICDPLQDGWEMLLLADTPETTLHAWIPGLGHRQLRFASPVVAARAVALPAERPLPAMAVACADGHIYLFDHQGERAWRYDVGAPVCALEAWDADGDGRPELLVGSSDGLVHVLDLEGRRRWSIHHGATIVGLAGVYLSADRVHLLVADAERTLQLVELIPPGGATERQLRREVAGAYTGLAERGLLAHYAETPAPASPFPGKALALLAPPGHWEQPKRQEMLLRMTDLRSNQGLLPGAQEILVQTLVCAAVEGTDPAAMAVFRERLVEWLRADAAPPQVQAAVLTHAVQSGALREETFDLWKDLLYQAAGHPHPAVRREVIRALQPFWMRQELPVDEHPAWDIIRRASRRETAAAAPGADEEWVWEELASIVRRRFRDDALGALVLTHRLIRHRVDPHWLTYLGAPDRYLLIDRQGQELFRQLGQLLTATAEELPAVLRRLAEALQQIVEAGRLDAGCALVRVYQGLARLAALETYAVWKEYFLGVRGGREHLWPLVEACRECPELLEGLICPLEELREIAAQGLQRMEKHDQYLVQLQQLSSNLEAFRSTRAVPPTDGDGLQAYWQRILSAILRRWVAGPLDQEIKYQSTTFQYQINLLDVRLLGDELQVEFGLANTGFVTAYDLSFSAPQADHDGQVLTCGVEAQFKQLRKSLEPGSQLTERLYVRADAGQWAAWAMVPGKAQIQVRLKLRYFVPPSQQEKDCSFAVPLPPTALRPANYPTSFPTAWASYSAALKRLLQGPPGVVLVECERGARRSFLHEVGKLVGQYRILDMREGYRVAASEWAVPGEQHLTVGPRELHLWLLRALWPDMDEELVDALRWRQSFRDAVRQVWEGMPEGVRPKVLVLDHFENFLYQMLQSKEERETLAHVLPFWLELVRETRFHLVLGGTNLLEKMLEAWFPEFRPRSVRPDYVVLDPSSWAEALRFLERELADRELEEALDFFTPRLTAEEILRLCGGNLSFVRTLALDGLEAALKQAHEDPANPARRNLGSARDYFLDYGQRTNFFSLYWAVLPFYERLALTLIAHSELPITEKKWLAPGLTLSRDYRPVRPPDKDGRVRLSSKVVARRDELLDEEAIGKIRASRQFRYEQVWVRGLVRKQATSLENNPLTRMCLRLLNAVGLDELLQKLVHEGALVQHALPAPLEASYDLRIPLLGDWFRSNKVLESMSAAAQGGDGGWCPRELFLDRRSGGNEDWLFPDRPLRPLHQEIPLEHLPKIHQSLQRDDLSLFLNLYGLGRKRGFVDPRSRWTNLVQLTEAIAKFEQSHDTVAQPLLVELFESFGRLLQRRPSDMPGSGGPVLQSIPQAKQDVAWQSLDFQQVLPGFQKQVLLAWVPDGDGLQDYRTELQARAEKLIPLPTPGDEDQSARAVVLLLALRNATPLQQALERKPGRIRYAVLDRAALAEVLVAPDPARHLLHLAQNRIGRHPFSPYKLYGPLEPGSPLFVGRRQEMERIRDDVATSDFLILGSRRIGKTSLLRHVQSQLDPQRFLPIPINLLGQDRVTSFYEKLRAHLKQDPQLQGYADRLGSGESSYADLRDLLVLLRQDLGRHPVFLLDEIDGLYRYDSTHNGRRFFEFLRNELAQATPRLCSFVMTGYQTVYLAYRDHGSVFFNFCTPLNVAQVSVESAAQLVDLLRDYGVELYHPEEAKALIFEGTYCLPWAIQAACDQLLEKLDRKRNWRVEKEDIEDVLSQEIAVQLRKELFDELLVEYPTAGIHPQVAQVRMQILLLCAVLHKYDFRLERDNARRSLTPEQQFFTAADVANSLDGLAPELRKDWPWTEAEIETLLRSLTITMALAPAEDGTSYYFPQEILPNLLFRQHYDARQPYDVLYRLADLIERHRVLAQQYPGGSR